MTVIRKKVVSPLGCQSCDPRSTILAIMSLLSALVEIQDTLTLSTRQYNKQVKLFFLMITICRSTKQDHECGTDMISKRN